LVLERLTELYNLERSTGPKCKIYNMCRFIVNKLSGTGYTFKNQAAFNALSAEGGLAARAS